MTEPSASAEQQPQPPEDQPPKLERVLVVAAHPDDPEFGFGATVARLTSEGTEVRYVICSDGSAGGEDPSVPDNVLTETRYSEQRAAAAELGVSDVVFLGFKDGHLVADIGLRMAISREIRRFKPDAVFTHWPQRNVNLPIGGSHPDHLAVGEATFAAVYPDARNPRAHRELLSEDLEAHTVKEIWIGGGENPNHVMDVTDHVDRKLAALARHRSQFEKPGREAWDVGKFVRERMARTGEQHGYRFAEAFRRIETG